MSKSFRVAFPMILTAMLSACGSGGGGPGGADRGSVVGEGPLPPQSPPAQTVAMQGISLAGSRTGGTFDLGDMDETRSTATLTYDAEGNLSSAGISTPQATLSFVGPGEISESLNASGQRTAFVGANEAYLAAVVDPTFHGWNYQSFGVWFSNVDTTPFQAGAMSFGAVSPVSALPMSSGEFTGQASGFYFDEHGTRFTTDAQMRALADFESRSIQFSTTGTLLDGGTPNSGLNLSGKLDYAAGGANHFSGNVETDNLELTGAATGRFYGPNAEEIGGVYGLTGAGSKRMLGGFGGKR